ncbi:uncharacterized protein LOC116195184 [Punica granatum]|uniref:Uncharacterized protein LOC116195184 n=1 Tax=Punica granatum TaxID=22663 RepID=A0A6P8CAQ2_PUNGR|nr:uncharacterized protein LOC116195184 [Punica granatum]XP_031380036.1 uncharacterized protein LOC116195184 [Punica granatum]
MQDPESILKFSVLWRGKKFIVEMNSGASLQNFGYELQKLTDIKSDTMRLIVPQFSSKSSKLLYPFSDEHSSINVQGISMDEGKTIRLMGVSEAEVDEILENEKVDLRIAGFDEEDKRLRRRMLGVPAGLIKLPQGEYIFADFRTLEIPGVKLNPPASEALKRMHMLAADPGIIAIMNEHRWRVGIMTEMAPVGYVGVSPKCILGFNKNHGEEISLRLRTDDLKGFRKYESIKKTLLHELAHMVYSEHDANFYALDKQLNQEAASLDWTRSQSRTLNGPKSHNHYDDEYYVSDISNLPRKLGGNASEQLASARESSVAAAYRRMANAPISNVVTSEVDAEPDPDDSRFFPPRKERPNTENLHNQKKLDVKPNPDFSDTWIDFEPDPDESHGTSIKTYRNQAKLDHEPDPDDHTDIRRNSEPDPDDSQGTDIKGGFTQRDDGIISPVPPLSIDEKSSDSWVLREPNPDDSSMIEDRVQSWETMREPDPDDSETKENDLGHGSDAKPVTLYTEPDPDDSLMVSQKASGMQIDEPDPDDQEMLSRIVQSRETMREPDPDDSETKESDLGYGSDAKPVTVYAEPDPDDSLMVSQKGSGMQIDEPDPDDQEKLSRIVQSRETMREPDPDDSETKESDLGYGSDAKPVTVYAEPDPDDSLMVSQKASGMQIDEPDPNNQETLSRIQDPVTALSSRMHKAIDMLRNEVDPIEASRVLQTLVKIIRNVMEHPNEMKYKRLRKSNPIIQRNVANYKAAMEIMSLIGFNEDIILDDTGKAETYLVLKRNDPGLLWLAKSSIETVLTC